MQVCSSIYTEHYKSIPNPSKGLNTQKKKIVCLNISFFKCQIRYFIQVYS